MELIIKTLAGLEEVLAEELNHLGLLNVEPLKRAVRCEGNWAQLYKCNYQLRTALRVLLPIKQFNVQTEDELYDSIRSIDWSQYIAPGKTFAINGTISSEYFKHSQYAIYKIKDAVVDQLAEKYEKRPSVDIDNPDVLLDIFISSDNLKVSLDSSGRSLHLRNYKYRQYKAPLNEVLAAGIIKLTGWDMKTSFHDPMAGSGTLVTEAHMMAANIPAAMFNKQFSFHHWPEFHSEIWNMVVSAADAAIHPPEVEITASDINGLAVRDVKKNIQKLPFREKIKIYHRDFFTLPGEAGKLLIMNPPYNKRIAVENVFEFYQKIGDCLKTNWHGSEAWVISSNIEAAKYFGLRPSRKISLNHGGSEAKLYKFELYAGSKKAKYQD